MNREELKKRVAEEIDRRQDEIIAVADKIWKHPELGFKEFGTAELVGEEFDRLRLQSRHGLAITGVKAIAEGGQPGPTVAIIGELDSILVADHPAADPTTGAAHCCGHNAQIANLIGAAIGLVGSGVMPELSGRLAFMAVPAEEYVEIEYRDSLRREGKLEFLGGKGELVRLGEFDDVDMAMMVHTGSKDFSEGVFGSSTSSNGFIAKSARFIGKAAHAAGAPHRGVNALYAATVAINAINALRETFQDEDAVRVHPIISRGGDLVNVIPSDVRVETYVRGKTVAAIESAAKKVDRALRAGAMALGAEVEITTLPGYLPLANDEKMLHLFRENFGRDYAPTAWELKGHGAGSTDMGDISHIMPAIHPYANGAVGQAHGNDWAIVDPYIAHVLPAKLMALTAIDLLADGARDAKGILDGYKPRMTKTEYLEFMRRVFAHETYDGSAE
ncbi:MAG: amidohydrolase [Thermomicrobiales bacterium]